MNCFYLTSHFILARPLYLREEPELPGRADEPDGVLQAEVGHADGVDDLQRVDDRGVALHAVVVVPVLGVLKKPLRIFKSEAVFRTQ